MGNIQSCGLNPNRVSVDIPNPVLQREEDSSQDAEGAYRARAIDIKRPKQRFAPRQRSTTLSDGSEVTEKVFPVVFRWKEGGRDVKVSGSFSNWKSIPMVKSQNDFVTIIDLPEGDHQFKFYVDGEWKLDPTQKIVENNIGVENNIISVNSADFEVFQALAMDIKTTAMQKGRVDPRDMEYGQDVPPFQQKPAGPPILPPHLTQGISDQDPPRVGETGDQRGSSHVTLNHMYTQVDDGVMVQSATHRYRNKYITTLFYKPS